MYHFKYYGFLFERETSAFNYGNRGWLILAPWWEYGKRNRCLWNVPESRIQEGGGVCQNAGHVMHGGWIKVRGPTTVADRKDLWANMETKKMPTEESKSSISYSREKFESDFMKIARLHFPQLSIARMDRPKTETAENCAS
jgi:hypothetical protein